MADANLFAVKLFDDTLGKLGQLQAGRDVGGRFTYLGRDLLDAVLGFLQVEQPFEAPCLLQRMHVAALEVFDKLRLQYLRVGHLADFNGNGFFPGDLRGTKTLRPKDDLVALVLRPYQQGRENTLRVDTVGILWRSPFCGRGSGEPRGNGRLPLVRGT